MKIGELIKKIATFEFNFTDEKRYFLENMAAMLAAGVDIKLILEGLKREAHSKKLQDLITKIQADIESGLSVSSTFKKYEILPPYLIALVTVGEQTGNLAKNLKVVVDQQNKDREFKAKLRSASLYPVLVLIVMTAIGTGVSLFVLPRLSTVYSSFEADLPFITKVFIVLGDFMGQYGGIAIPVFFGILLFLAYFVFIRKQSRSLGQRIILKIPIIKTIILEVEISRMGYMMGILVDRGFTAVEALTILSESSTYFNYKELYASLAKEISEGSNFNMAFQKVKNINKMIPLFPRQIIVSGEKSGTLATSFLYVGEDYEKKNELTTKNLAVLFEPVLLITVWIGVALLALAVIMPIYSLVGDINNLSSQGGQTK